MRKLLFACLMLVAASPVCLAEIRTSAVFGDSMVLQREKPIHVWGWTAPDRGVEVSLAGNAVTVKSDADGRFDAKLPALQAGGPHTMKISSDGETLTYDDVLIGEVSTVNDDLHDNIFREPIGRFANVEEDVDPLHLLVSDYALLLK